MNILIRHFFTNKNSSNYNIFNSDDDIQIFKYKFNIKNLYDYHIRKEAYIDDDIINIRIEYKNNIYYYDISIFKLKIKEETNFTPEKMKKDIYHKGLLANNYFWDFLEFSYKVK